MSDLSDIRVIDRLKRLAADAPTHLADADLVWALGRRRQHTRWAANAAAAAAVSVLGALLVPSALVQVQPPLAAAGEGFVLPDVVRKPGAWEPAFPAAPGRLSAVGIGSRSGLWSTRTSGWGVSATSGASRFLDLPGAAQGAGAPALSADGWRLAYWVTGDVAEGPIPGTGDADPVVGIAVIDLATGEVSRWDIASDHGLSTQGGAAWAGDVLWWSAGPLRDEGDGGTSARLTTRTWNPVTDERRDVTDGPGISLYPGGTGDAPGGFVTIGRPLVVRRVVGNATTASIRVDRPAGTERAAGIGQPAIGPDGVWLAGLLVPDASVDGGAPQSLVAGTTGAGAVALEKVNDVEAQTVLGWRSPTEVVVGAQAEPDGEGAATVFRARSVDVVTGEMTRLLDFEGNVPDFAADGWAGDVVVAPDAPFAPDLRLVVLGGAVVVAFLVSLWRSIRGRRGHP